MKTAANVKVQNFGDFNFHFFFINYLLLLGFLPVLTYLPDLANKLAIGREESAFLISIIAIATTVSRVVTGLLADRPSVDNLLFSNIVLVLGGAAAAVRPLCTSYALLACTCTVFGMSIGIVKVECQIIHYRGESNIFFNKVFEKGPETIEREIPSKTSHLR